MLIIIFLGFIPLLFQTLDALYIETRKLPLNCNSFAISKLGHTLYFTFCKVKDNFR